MNVALGRDARRRRNRRLYRVSTVDALLCRSFSQSQRKTAILADPQRDFDRAPYRPGCREYTHCRLYGSNSILSEIVDNSHESMFFANFGITETEAYIGIYLNCNYYA